MNFPKVILLTVLTLTFLIATPNVQAEWWITDGEEDILLDRIDDDLSNDSSNPDPSIPWHEEDAGTYGYWDDSEWVEVISDGDVNTAYYQVAEWRSGSLDYYPVSQ